MDGATRFATLGTGLVVLTTAVSAQDLSVYRDFSFGMNLASVAAQTTTNPSDLQRVHQRPAVIDELVWRPRAEAAAPAGHVDPVEEIVFSFYDDALFRVVITYGRRQVEGLTEQDIVDGISSVYGPASTPEATVNASRLSQRYRGDGDGVLARWEDAAHSLDLIRPSYGSTFAIVMYSKPLDAAAGEAVIEALRLDRLEAPAREIERRQQADADAEAAADKARRLNQPAFRP